MTPTLERVAFPALGTTAVIVTDARDVAAVREVVDDEIRRIDLACSRFRDDSELASVTAAEGRPVEVSDVFLDALDVALRAARLTDGRVDPTVGTALRVLGYDRDFAQVPATGPPTRVRVAPVAGWRVIEVDRLRRTVRVPAGVELDFGATAKARCADRAAHAATRATAGRGVLVALGGDIAVAGCAPSGGWRIGLSDDHRTQIDAADETVVLHDGGLATSGTTVRRWTRGGEERHHVVDPAAGRSAAPTWRTVTVAAASCVDANIATTAAIVLGRDAPAWLTSRRLPARLVASDGTIARIAGWPSADDALPGATAC